MKCQSLPSLVLLSLTLLLVSGCASPVQEDGRLRHKQFTVELSSLDWIEIAYFPSRTNSLIKNPCRLSLFGSGEVEFQTGRSPQLWSAFSDKVDDPYWNDLFKDRMHLSPDEMQSVYQAFVDEGIVPKGSFTLKEENVKPPYIKVSAQIGREKVRMATDNPRLIQLVEDAMQNFVPILEQAAQARLEDEKP